MLPPFNGTGDLPPEIHIADWTEIERHFGQSPEARVRAYARLRHLHELANRTGALLRFIVFGSFVSTVAAPRDVDVVLPQDPAQMADHPRRVVVLDEQEVANRIVRMALKLVNPTPKKRAAYRIDSVGGA